MLDVHGLIHTPGATTTLGTGADTIPVGDGAQVAGVPLRQDAILRMFGVHSVLANTLAIVKLQSQDMADPINGYTVTNVHYGLNGTTPSDLASVSFDIAPTVPSTGTVKIQVVTSGTWFNCSVAIQPNWSCTITGVTALQANNLRVVAAQ